MYLEQYFYEQQTCIFVCMQQLHGKTAPLAINFVFFLPYPVGELNKLSHFRLSKAN